MILYKYLGYPVPTHKKKQKMASSLGMSYTNIARVALHKKRITQIRVWNNWTTKSIM